MSSKVGFPTRRWLSTRAGRRAVGHGERHHSPATRRNREHILVVLQRVLPRAGVILEIASGSGEHAAWMGPRLPGVEWQPSDADPDKLDSIAMWSAEAADASIREPLLLDAATPRWPIDAIADRVGAIVCINLIHIVPWRTCESLLRGAGRELPVGGVLYLYGPFRRHDVRTAPSNEAFDESLRATDPSWGLRDLDEVTALARENGLEPSEVLEMPANNLSVIFSRR
jgi:hypothetical protein